MHLLISQWTCPEGKLRYCAISPTICWFVVDYPDILPIRMEDLLLNIVKEAGGAKLSNVKQAAQESYGKNILYSSPNSR